MCSCAQELLPRTFATLSKADTLCCAVPVPMLLQMLESDMEQAFLAGDNTGMVRGGGGLKPCPVRCSSNASHCPGGQQQGSMAAAQCRPQHTPLHPSHHHFLV
jgi:hypothetical protein